MTVRGGAPAPARTRSVSFALSAPIDGASRGRLQSAPAASAPHAHRPVARSHTPRPAQSRGHARAAVAGAAGGGDAASAAGDGAAASVASATVRVPPAERPITSGSSAAAARVGGSVKAPRVTAIAWYLCGHTGSKQAG